MYCFLVETTLQVDDVSSGEDSLHSGDEEGDNNSNNDKERTDDDCDVTENRPGNTSSGKLIMPTWLETHALLLTFAKSIVNVAYSCDIIFISLIDVITIHYR